MLALCALLVVASLASFCGYLSLLALDYIRDAGDSVVGTTSDLDDMLEASPTRCIVSLASLDSGLSFRTQDAAFWAEVNPSRETVVVSGVNQATTHRAVRLAALRACQQTSAGIDQHVRTMHGLGPEGPRFAQTGTRIMVRR